MRLTRNPNRPPGQQWGAVAVVAVLAAGLWFGWFGWDTEYQYDAATGRTTGPYEVWQGVGALLCGVVVAALAYRLLRFAVAVLVLPAFFTLAWIITAAAADSSGLWVIGAVLVAVGSVLGAGLLLGIAATLNAVLRGRRRSGAAR